MHVRQIKVSIFSSETVAYVLHEIACTHSAVCSFLSATGNWTLAFGYGRFVRPTLATAGLFVNFLDQQLLKIRQRQYEIVKPDAISY